MYIKISKRSQLITLRSLNPYLGKHRVPGEILHELEKLRKSKCHGKGDFIALFLKPVKDDTAEILDALQIYLAKAEFNDNNFYQIAASGKKKAVWMCAELRIRKTKQKIFAVYSIREKHLDRKGGC